MTDYTEPAPENQQTISPRIYSLRRASEVIPDDAVIVDRSTRWGNPYLMHGMSEAERNRVCDAFEAWAAAKAAKDPEWLAPLRGKSLVCWCQSPGDAKPKRCHAEFLIKLANAEEGDDGSAYTLTTDN